MGQYWSEDNLGSAIPTNIDEQSQSEILVGFWIDNYSLGTPNLHDPYGFVL